MYHVLIVEDDTNIRKFIAVNLMMRGYKVLEAASAEDAIMLLEGCCPDLMLLDLGLPGMTGLEMLRQLEMVNALEFPVVVLSAWADGQTHTIQTTHPRIVNVLTKPVSYTQLLDGVRGALSFDHERAG
ncbi:MAG: response regulator [bacterium]|nr:response regulator [bacterium]